MSDTPAENRLPTGNDKRKAVRAMFDAIAPRYDLLNRLLTFRLDVRWRRLLIKTLDLPPQSQLADLACGTGDFCRELTSKGHLVFGFDLSMGMLRAARCPRSSLVQADVLALPLKDACVDGVTCGFALRNLVDIPALFEEVARIIRPGGRVGLLEIAEPSDRFLRYGHSVYFNRVVPFIGGLISNREAYQYLPRSAAYLPSANELRSSLKSMGFTNIRHQYLSVGIAQIITATRNA